MFKIEYITSHAEAEPKVLLFDFSITKATAIAKAKWTFNPLHAGGWRVRDETDKVVDIGPEEQVDAQRPARDLNYGRRPRCR